MLIIFQLFVPPVRLELTHYYYFIPVSKTGVSTIPPRGYIVLLKRVELLIYISSPDF